MARDGVYESRAALIVTPPPPPLTTPLPILSPTALRPILFLNGAPPDSMDGGVAYLHRDMILAEISVIAVWNQDRTLRPGL